MTFSITVDQVAQRARAIDVHCTHCDRHRRLSMSQLLLQLGANAPIWEAWRGLKADCPKRDAQGAAAECSLYSPTLAPLFLRQE